MASEIYLPKMSDHMEEGTIIRWLVKEGEAVTRGQVLLEIETDKAVGEIEAPIDGVLKGVRAGDGDTVSVGETIAYVARPDERVPAQAPLGSRAPASSSPAQQVAPTEQDAPAQQVAPTESVSVPEPGAAGLVPATPVARRVAKELGVNINKVKGTGPGGRVKEEDVRAYSEAQSVKAQPAPAAPMPAPVQTVATAPLSAASTPQGATTLSLTHIQQITGQRMLESTQQAPHFYLQVSADMTEVQRLIEKARTRSEAETSGRLSTGGRLSVTAVLVKAAAQALKKYPRANSSFQNGALQLYPEVNIGVAVGTEDGLVVPVIKSADRKGLPEIALELKNFQAKAQTMHFSPEELSGGSFTVSNLGMYGIDIFTAIINPPQSSILAVGRIINTPTGLEDGSIALRPLMALSLSVDHRCMDGLQGARFLGEIKQLLEEPTFML